MTRIAKFDHQGVPLSHLSSDMLVHWVKVIWAKDCDFWTTQGWEINFFQTKHWHVRTIVHPNINFSHSVIQEFDCFAHTDWMGLWGGDQWGRINSTLFMFWMWQCLFEIKKNNEKLRSCVPWFRWFIAPLANSAAIKVDKKSEVMFLKLLILFVKTLKMP